MDLLQPQLVWLDRYPKTEAGEAVLIKLGLLLCYPGHYRRPGRVDFEGVLVRLRPRHPPHDPTKGDLDVLKTVTLAVQHHHLIRRKLSQPCPRLFVDLREYSGHASPPKCDA